MRKGIQPDAAREELVDELLHLRVKVSLALEGLHPDYAAISSMQKEIIWLEAELCRRQQIPYPTMAHRTAARQSVQPK